MLNLNSILLFSDDPKSLGEFYEKVFSKKPDMAEHGYYGFLVGKTFLNIGPHDKVKGKNKNPERFMFNLETSDVKAEFERLKKIKGIKVIAEPYGMDGWDGLIATLADPDGNYFQIMPPWEPEK